EQIERRAKAAEEKIARAEAQAIAEVRAQAADLAIETARGIIKDRMDKGAQAALIEKSISELRGKLN
ncbi:MAG: F0F1 ATP synthase subunit B, partial [Amphiplicatus sp.]